MAERLVQTIKCLLKKATHDNQDQYIALLDHRNTPISETLGSPAQRLIGRHTRILIPILQNLVKPKTINPKSVQNELLQRKAVRKHYYDHHTKPLENLKENEAVLMQVKDTWHPAKAMKICKNMPRSYIITTPQDKSHHRNRRHLRKVKEEWTPLEQSDKNEIYDSPLNNDTINNDPPDSSQPATITMTTLRRPQHTIRKPERYPDS